MSHFNVGVFIPRRHISIESLDETLIRDDIHDYLETVMEPYEEQPDLEGPYVLEHDRTKEFINAYLTQSVQIIQKPDGSYLNNIPDEETYKKITFVVPQEDIPRLKSQNRMVSFANYLIGFNIPFTEETGRRALKDGYLIKAVPAYLHEDLYHFLLTTYFDDETQLPVILYDYDDIYPAPDFIRVNQLNNTSLFSKWENEPPIEEDFHGFEIISVYNDNAYWDYWLINKRYTIPLKDGTESAITKVKYVSPQYKDGSLYFPFAFIDTNGEWYHPGRMGWFGQDDSTEKSREEYIQLFQRTLQNAEPEDIYVQLDCHI